MTQYVIWIDISINIENIKYFVCKIEVENASYKYEAGISWSENRDFLLILEMCP